MSLTKFAFSDEQPWSIVAGKHSTKGKQQALSMICFMASPSLLPLEGGRSGDGTGGFFGGGPTGGFGVCVSTDLFGIFLTFGFKVKTLGLFSPIATSWSLDPDGFASSTSYAFAHSASTSYAFAHLASLVATVVFHGCWIHPLSGFFSFFSSSFSSSASTSTISTGLNLFRNWNTSGVSMVCKSSRSNFECSLALVMIWFQNWDLANKLTLSILFKYRDKGCSQVTQSGLATTRSTQGSCVQPCKHRQIGDSLVCLSLRLQGTIAYWMADLGKDSELNVTTWKVIK